MNAYLDVSQFWMLLLSVIHPASPATSLTTFPLHLGASFNRFKISQQRKFAKTLSSFPIHFKVSRKNHSKFIQSQASYQPQRYEVAKKTHWTKLKFSVKDLFSKCDQIRRKLWIWSHLLKKSLMENFIFCAVIQGSLN